jgi:hypothetical protein
MYHSFRNDEIKIFSSLERLEKDGDIAFAHDLTLGLPKDYNDCDILYSEPSWLLGYDIFSKRAETISGSYKTYIDVLSKLTFNKKPIVLIIGKNALKKMNQNFTQKKVKLNNHWETAYGWNIDISKYDVNLNYDLIKCLSKDFNKVGDMNCGYGNTGRIFKDNGKNFVMSDINSKTIYYVAKKLMNYENIS